MRGSQNVLIRDVGAYAQIQVSVGGAAPRRVPLERAHVPVGGWEVRPSRLLRARAAVVPWTARDDVRNDLTEWARSAAPYAVRIVGGRGGSGKTRLGVELCRIAAEQGWLCGMLRGELDLAQIEALADTATPRLIVVDYAETRGEHLQLLLPELAGSGSAEHPIRVLLLIRAKPPTSGDWTAPLRNRGDVLDAELDRAEVLALQEAPFTVDQRLELFEAADREFARIRQAGAASAPAAAVDLSRPVFASPLLVLSAALLAAYGEAVIPTTRGDLFAGLASHEDRYWAHTTVGRQLDASARQRVIALASLAGADTETEANALLTLIPDFADASAERRGALARWARELYPGARFWNPVEPDVLGEYLAAACFTDQPGLLAGVLDRQPQENAARPLEVYARLVQDDPTAAEAISAAVTADLARLTAAAVDQVAHHTDLAVMLAGTTLAAALAGALQTLPIRNAERLDAAYQELPPRDDVVLNPLALILTAGSIAADRAESSLTPDEPSVANRLAGKLNNLAIRLAKDGQRAQALSEIQAAVDIRRRLAAANPVAYEPDLARSLHTLSNRLGEDGQRAAALTEIQAAVDIRRRLAVGERAS